MKASALWLMAAAALVLAPATAQYNPVPPDRMPPTTPDYSMPGHPIRPRADTQPVIDGAQKIGVSLNTLDNARRKLANATVEDSSGAAVGTVSRVQTSASGNIRKVVVSLTSGNKIVAIPASDLRFNMDRNTLNADLSRTQIDNLPSI